MTDGDEPTELGKVDVATLANYRLVDRLAESERRHRELLDDLPDVVVRLSSEGEILYVNNAWRSRFGLEPSACIGGRFVSHLHPDDHPRFDRLIAPEVTGEEADRTLRILDRDGRTHLVETRLRRLDDEEIVGILEDVTVRQQLETERVRAQRLESIGRLAGGLAHDFNNLLSVVLGNVELAQSRLDPDSRGAHELEHAMRACIQATEIAKQMLVFSKGGDPRRQPECIERIVEEAFELYLRGSRVVGDIEVEPGVGMVDVDASQMHQVLNNLILNAIDAMPEGGTLRGRVTRATTSGGDPGVRISIRDEGHGIPADQLDQVFEPYFTTKDAGNGLGLTSTYGIVMRHGGEIEVDSEVGVGTEFRIVLEAVEGEKHRPEPASAPPGGAPACRVLLMDDDEMVRGVMVAMLEALGHSVIESRHGQECVDAFRKAEADGSPFDVVILDLTIVGGHDGLWTIGRLREIDPEVRALVATGYNNASVVADPEEHGFVGSVSKPTSLEALGENIRSALARGSRG